MVELNQKKAAESIFQWAEMTQLLLDMKLAMIQSKHPEWPEKRISEELNRQLRVLRDKKRPV